MPKLGVVWGLVAIYAGSTVTAFIDEPIRVKNVLDQPGFPFVRILGACHITSRGATCWDTEGKPFKSLGEWITAYYITNQLNDLAIKPGAKNRWVAIERTSDNSYRNSDQSEFESGYLGGYVEHWRTNTRLEWVRAEVVPGNRFTSLPMSFRKELPPVYLELKRGATVALGGNTITITHFGPNPRPKARDAESRQDAQEKFVIRMKCEKSIASGYPFDAAILRGKDGLQIQFVDDKGKPVDPGESSGRKRESSSTSIDDSTPFEIECKTNVDPRFISRIQFFQSEVRRVVFVDIPIDPSPKLETKSTSNPLAKDRKGDWARKR